MSKFVPIVLRTFNNFDAKENSDSDVLHCKDVSLTVQDAADECDINYIVRRYGITGQLPTALHPPTYGDFVGISDYQTALNAINAADDAFMEMPANVRSRFDNDAGKFVEFCSDPANRDEMLKLGLLDPAVVAKPGSSASPGAAGGQAEGAAGAQPTT